jgi:hypothetical protein
MRLTKNNIAHIVELTVDGCSFSWHVAMKGYQMSDARHYSNTDERGRTLQVEFKNEWLPKAVQEFIASHPRAVREQMEYKGKTFIHYIYK